MDWYKMRPIYFISIVLLFVNFNVGHTLPSESYRYTERKVDAFWNDEDSRDIKMNIDFKENHGHKSIRSPLEDLAAFSGGIDNAKMLLKHHRVVGFRCGDMNGMRKCNEDEESQHEGQEQSQEETQGESQSGSQEERQDGGSDSQGGSNSGGENSQGGSKRSQYEGIRCGDMNGMERCNEGSKGQEGGEGRGGQEGGEGRGGQEGGEGRGGQEGGEGRGQGRGSGGYPQGGPNRGQNSQGGSGRLESENRQCGGTNGMARCNEGRNGQGGGQGG